MARVFRRYKSVIYGNYRKAAAIDGAVAGAVMAVVMLARDLLAAAPAPAPENYITELVLAVAIFWSSYHYRKGLDDGRVTLKELLLLGIGIGIVSAVVYGLWVWLYCGCIDPARTAYYCQQRAAVMTPATESPEARRALELALGYTAGDWGFIAGFRSAVMSVIIAFFAALILRTEKSPLRQPPK